jgi:hypothetical protein
MGYEVWQKSGLVARSYSIITCCTDLSLSFFFGSPGVAMIYRQTCWVTSAIPNEPLFSGYTTSTFSRVQMSMNSFAEVITSATMISWQTNSPPKFLPLK